MGIKYDGNVQPEEQSPVLREEFPARREEFVGKDNEYFRPPEEFPSGAEEFPSGGAGDAEETGDPRRREKRRRSRVVRQMGYCVAAAVSVVCLSGTVSVPYILPESGAVVENNSLSCVADALTGAGIQARIVVHAESKNGRQVKTVRCDREGNYSLQLSAGTYVLEISASGYITEYFTLEVYEDDAQIMDRYTLSPELGPGQYRIVLEWGDIPSDLDSHLSGVLDSGTEIYVFYGDCFAWDGDRTVAMLDRDDTDYYGPETTTIYDKNGTFTYRIYDFTNGGNEISTALAQSGATVKLYQYGSREPRVYTVPSGAGCWWHVFDIDHGRIIDVNTRE